MGKFNAALLWLGAPLVLALAGTVPVWAAVAWVLAPIAILVSLGVGAGAIAWIMDTCTGDRALRGQGANAPKTSRAVMMAPPALTLHHPGSH
jgi:hypothetical protein